MSALIWPYNAFWPKSLRFKFSGLGDADEALNLKRAIEESLRDQARLSHLLPGRPPQEDPPPPRAPPPPPPPPPPPLHPPCPLFSTLGTLHQCLSLFCFNRASIAASPSGAPGQVPQTSGGGQDQASLPQLLDVPVEDRLRPSASPFSRLLPPPAPPPCPLLSRQGTLPNLDQCLSLASCNRASNVSRALVSFSFSCRCCVRRPRSTSSGSHVALCPFST